MESKEKWEAVCIMEWKEAEERLHQVESHVTESPTIPATKKGLAGLG